MKIYHVKIICIYSISFFFVTLGYSQRELKSANRLFEKQRYYEALLEYKDAENSIRASDTKSLALCYLKMGECYNQLRYFSLALQCFNKALQHDSIYVSGLPIYRDILKTNGKYKEALNIFLDKQNDEDNSKHNNLLYYSFPVTDSKENKLFVLQDQKNVHTLGKKRGLSLRNGKLHYATTSFPINLDQTNYLGKISNYKLFSAQYSNGVLENSNMENTLMDVKDNITYTTIQFINEIQYLFFTTLNSKGEEVLFESQQKEGQWQSPKRVFFSEKEISVSHPVFNHDGKIMIFSADLDNGYGGKDLWYSVLGDKGWSEPINMGNKINTSEDEITPFLYQDYLFFSSNGHIENYGGFDIYGTLWTPYKIGEVQNLKLPYNSYADDFDLVVDNNSQIGFFISTRDTSTLDDKIYGFTEVPNFTILKGIVLDGYKNPINDVIITILEGEIPIYTVQSDSDGNYLFYLKNNKHYKIQIEKKNYLSKVLHYSTITDEHITNNTVSEMIQLDGFDLNVPYKTSDLFSQTADIELNNNSEQLAVIKTFLKENSHLDLYIYMFCYLTENDEFNDLINIGRVNSLKNYFIIQSVNENRIHYETYTNEVPTNFNKIDYTNDPSYLIYFVMTPRNEKTVVPISTTKN